MNIKIISAGAGSGKTYRLTSEMVELLRNGAARPSGIIATTFTNKAAAELQERVRMRLLEEGMSATANELSHALIGTVHSLCVKLLKRFALEAGISPQVDIIAEDDQAVIFGQSIATVMEENRVERIEQLAAKFGISAAERYARDWRSLLKELIELARANDFGAETLDESKQRSIDSFLEYLRPDADQAMAGAVGQLATPDDWRSALELTIARTIEQLDSGSDPTKTTANVKDELSRLHAELRQRGELYWPDWARISKMRVGKKSEEAMEPLLQLSSAHWLHPAFRQDISDFIGELFDLAVEALNEYAQYKGQRGLIDYTDMEVLLRRLLDQPAICDTLKEELDLLMVDEFQDTNPIQLDIFLKLSKYARLAIWVGDPKQSIYGFRGAEPAIIQALIAQQGGLSPENIQRFSYRSREALVHFSNCIFTRAFDAWPEEQIALEAKRRPDAEPVQAVPAIQFWQLTCTESGFRYRNDWTHRTLAEALRGFLDEGNHIFSKQTNNWRPVQPGDIAVLCRSNNGCMAVATALHEAGLKASIARPGLLATAEAQLIVACLKLLLNRYDSLAVAEIWRLATGSGLEEIVRDRMRFLEMMGAGTPEYRWGAQVPVIGKINALRNKVGELSSSEMLQILLDELDLRRLIVAWGDAEQRLSNVDQFCLMAAQYEDACNRMHTAASLGGFLLWLANKERVQQDVQATSRDDSAVNVLTYHKSKGLEYPVVVCFNLEEAFRADIWGVHVVRASPEIDLADVLGNRWLRLWVNPYANQFQHTVLQERIAHSVAQEEVTQQALAEEKRVLYVGITRARDGLILPGVPRKDPIWLQRTMQQGVAEGNAIGDGHRDRWNWKGQPIPIAHKEIEFGPSFEKYEPSERSAAVLYQEPAAGRSDHLPVYFDHKAIPGDFSAVTIERIAVSEWTIAEENRPPTEEVMRSFFRALRFEYSRESLEAMASELTERAGLPLGFSEALVQRAEALKSWLILKNGSAQGRYLVPLIYEDAGRQYRSVIDLLLRSNDRIVLLQYFTKAASLAEAQDKGLKGEAANLHFGKLAALKNYALKSCVCYLHFPLSGEVVLLDL